MDYFIEVNFTWQQFLSHSRLTLNSDVGTAVATSQVSLNISPSSPIQLPQKSAGDTEQKPSLKRSPMLKSYSQDTDANTRSEARLKVFIACAYILLKLCWTCVEMVAAV